MNKQQQDRLDEIVGNLTHSANEVSENDIVTPTVEEFYETILPPTRNGSVYCVSHMRVDGKWHNEHRANLDDALSLVKKYSDLDYHVFVALSTFNIVDDNFSRKAKFADQTRAIWFDIDVDHDDVEYQYRTKEEALKALKAITGNPLPNPTYIVSSGNGLHVYWALERAMDSTELKILAGQFRDAALGLGLKFDSVLTNNMACVLRALGSSNVKEPAGKVPRVEILQVGEILTINEAKNVRSLRSTKDTAVACSFSGVTNINADLEMPSEPVNIAELVSALEHISPELYPIWWATLCSLKAADLPSEQVKEIARRWSKRSQKHSESEFKRVYEAITVDGGRNLASLFFDAREMGWDGSVSLKATASLPEIDPSVFEENVEALSTVAMDASSLFNKYVPTSATMDAIANSTYAVDDLIIEGHIVMVPARAGAGKTTIMMHESVNMAAKGYKVFYINADISGPDAKRDYQIASDAGFTLALPDLTRSSMKDVINDLRALVIAGAELHKNVIVLDTFKKATDVMSKSGVSDFLSMLRALSALGATVILLGHCTKYNDENGRPVFDGVGDIRNDVDEMIYLIPVKNPNGSITVSTDPDKTRGEFKPITYTLGADRSVRREGTYIDTKQQAKDVRQHEDDQEAIIAITSCIELGINTTERIIKSCFDVHNISRREARVVLNRYKLAGVNQRWVAIHSKEKNKVNYSLVDKK